jgi:chromosome segregation ATPase
MGKSLDAAKREKEELEEKLSVLESQNETLRNVDHDVGSQLGKLRYQNENHKVQKSSMGQALAQKEMDIKKQQLDIDELARQLAEAESKVKELGNVSGMPGDLQCQVSIKLTADSRARLSSWYQSLYRGNP